MHPKFVKVAAPLWAGLYFVIFYLFGGPIFLACQLYWGLWVAISILTVLFGIWGTIFYLILLQSNLFEHFRDTAGNFLKNRHGKVFDWIRQKYFAKNDHSPLSPFLIMLIFIVLNPLVGVPLIRYSLHKNDLWKGIFWILAGSILKVVTWYLPIYGVGFSMILSFWR